MTTDEHDHQDEDKDREDEISDIAADATEESRRAHAGRTIADEPESGLLSGEPDDDELDPRT